MKRYALAIALLVSNYAFADTGTYPQVVHEDVNPDVLHELFMASDLVSCDEISVCHYIETGKPYSSPQRVFPEKGFYVVFPDSLYDGATIDAYTPKLTELYKDLIDETNKQTKAAE
jgi:hypothetical protein